MGELWGRPAGPANDTGAYRHSGPEWHRVVTCLAQLGVRIRAVYRRIHPDQHPKRAHFGRHSRDVIAVDPSANLTIMVTSFTEARDYPRLSLGQGCLVIDLFSFHLTRTI